MTRLPDSDGSCDAAVGKRSSDRHDWKSQRTIDLAAASKFNKHAGLQRI
jgi:hypothetical protein